MRATPFRFALPVLAVLAVAAAGQTAAAADAANGAKVWKKCKACHTLEAGKKKLGPSLAGIIGRKAGTVEGYKYSKAMMESGIVWTEANLDAYLKKPRSFVKGTKMAFAGLRKDADRADVIAYILANGE